MPVIMMTSVDTLYEVISQDTKPINQLGAPTIDASFNGLTQMGLQSPSSRLQNRELAEATFKQQQKYLNDAAQVAVNIFNPVATDPHRFRATVKLSPLTGQLQPFDDQSESSGLAYTLSLALSWGDKKGLFNQQPLPEIPIFATGCVPVDCYVRPIGHLLKKIHYACRYMENHPSYGQGLSPRFYVFIPKANVGQYEEDLELQKKVASLGGEVIGVEHASQALQQLMGDHFDGGVFTNIDDGFAGLASISYQQRHLFMGREALVKELVEKSRSALEQSYVLNVTGVSGSGKSSAVMAGLVPQLLKHIASSRELRKLEFNPNWLLVRPSQFASRQAVLTELLSDFCTDYTIIKQWLALAHQPQVLAQTVAQYLSEKADESQEYKHSLWVVDQYEELFTHSGFTQAEAQSFFPLLAALADQLPLLIITVLRTEYLSALGGQASIDVQLPRRIAPKDIEHIISLQLQYHRLSTESAQADNPNVQRQQHLEHRIKNDAIGKPLTTISYLLQQMHHEMVAENPSATLLTHAHYEAVDGIGGVMARQAELAMEAGLEAVDSHEQDACVDSFFEAFIGIDSEQQLVARALDNHHIDYYPKGVSALIDAFMSKGLIIDCGRGDTPKIKLAHDTLLPSLPQIQGQICWTRLLQWAEQNRDFLGFRQSIEPLFLAWLEQGQKDKHYLLSHGPSLRQAKALNAATLTGHRLLQTFIEQSQKRFINRRVYPSVMVLVLLLATGLGVWDQYFRIKTQYAAFIGERYGVPFGISPLDSQQRLSRQFHYRLDYKAGRLLSLSRHNSYGALKNDVNKDNAARWHYQYTEEGALLREDSFAQNGKPLVSRSYEFTEEKNLAQVRFKFHGSSDTLGDIAYQSANFEGQQKNKSQITQHRLHFDPQGFTEKRLFFNSHQQPVKDASGAYGLKYYYDDRGLIIRLEYIGHKGNSISINGVHTRAYERDEQGNISAKTWLDNNNQPILNQEGYARTITRYDEYGNLIEKTYQKDNGELSVHKHGFVRATAIYDNSGNQIERQFLDKQGNPVLHKWGFARMELSYDEYGNAVEWKYFDKNNQPTLRNGRFFRVSFAYDDLGNRISERYFGLDNQPVNHPNGYAQLNAKYDKQGNLLEESYYDGNGKPTLHKRGYASIRSDFDNNGRKIKRAFFGIDGEPVLNRYGYAHFTAEFDAQGNRTQVSFYGRDNQPINNLYGFARVAKTYNPQGQNIEIAYYNTNDQLSLHKDGVAIIRLSYDEQGNITGVRYFDTHNKPTVRSQGYAKLELGYDERGNRIREHYFNTEGELVIQKAGYAIAEIHFDQRNNPIEWTYFDTQHRPKANQRGYARIIVAYNEQDVIIGSAYYDETGQQLGIKGRINP